ncbi:MAG: hypothetical protein SXA11_07395 [Cyanobacteriota bacterium]|nr:hypothetical protein [Cyanobacteriota bacterium]
MTIYKRGDVVRGISACGKTKFKKSAFWRDKRNYDVAFASRAPRNASGTNSHEEISGIEKARFLLQNRAFWVGSGRNRWERQQAQTLCCTRGDRPLTTEK